MKTETDAKTCNLWISLKWTFLWVPSVSMFSWPLVLFINILYHRTWNNMRTKWFQITKANVFIENRSKKSCIHRCKCKCLALWNFFFHQNNQHLAEFLRNQFWIISRLCTYNWLKNNWLTVLFTCYWWHHQLLTTSHNQRLSIKRRNWLCFRRQVNSTSRHLVGTGQGALKSPMLITFENRTIYWFYLLFASSLVCMLDITRARQNMVISNLYNGQIIILVPIQLCGLQWIWLAQWPIIFHKLVMPLTYHQHQTHCK